MKKCKKVLEENENFLEILKSGVFPGCFSGVRKIIFLKNREVFIVKKWRFLEDLMGTFRRFLGGFNAGRW